jgi:hypothetical protein
MIKASPNREELLCFMTEKKKGKRLLTQNVLNYTPFQRPMHMSYTPPDIRSVNVTRYVTPLREGGSLPAIAEADDDFLYVLKFRGAGQGVKALVAEIIGGEIARAIGLKVPEMVFANLDEAFGRTEPDEEIQDLLKASVGLNVGLHYLSGAITFDPVVNHVEPTMASKIVWLDMLLTNVDRTARNTNMLVWNKELWLIDHGAALYFHHAWHKVDEQGLRLFPQVKDHVLLPFATELQAIDEQVQLVLSPSTIEAIVNVVPDAFLADEENEISIEEKRSVYKQFLTSRLTITDTLIKEANDARQAII